MRLAQDGIARTPPATPSSPGPEPLLPFFYLIASSGLGCYKHPGRFSLRSVFTAKRKAACRGTRNHVGQSFVRVMEQFFFFWFPVDLADF